MSVEELVAKILDYRPFYRNGGVTLTGGEPLAQPEFAAALLRRLKEEGLHAAVDTAGSIPISHCKDAVDLADLLLLDIKALDPHLCHTLTGADNCNTKDMLKYRQKQNQPVWIRHVLVPGYTLDQTALEHLAEYLSTFSCIQRVDLLPFHQLGSHKWRLLNIPYSLENTQPPSAHDVAYAKKIFQTRGLNVF